MPSRLSLSGIRDHWRARALAHGASPRASWTDEAAIALEGRTLLPYISPDDCVLDCGCATGHTTALLAARRPCCSFTGVDYIPEMISAARRAHSAENLHFTDGNILNLRFPSSYFDVVLTTRVLCNLHDMDHQILGLMECARVLLPGGTLLLSEPTVDGLEGINRLRTDFGLSSIPVPDYNCYLDPAALSASVDDVLELIDIVHFSSSYFLLTRILKPLLSLGPAFNDWASTVPPVGTFGTQKMLVFRKH
jgi:SAM-dependent methyltransferase